MPEVDGPSRVGDGARCHRSWQTDLQMTCGGQALVIVVDGDRQDVRAARHRHPTPAPLKEAESARQPVRPLDRALTRATMQMCLQSTVSLLPFGRLI